MMPWVYWGYFLSLNIIKNILKVLAEHLFYILF